MSEDQIKKIIDQLADYEKRISTLEGEKASSSKIEQLKIKQKPNPKNKGENLFPPIQKLLNDKFFEDWQTDVDVCKELTVKLLTNKKPLRPSVVNVLRAMVKKGLLVRDKIQKNKRQAFAYKEP